METKNSNSRMQNLITLTDEIMKVLQKVKNQTDLDQKGNAEYGRWEFAYVKYYLVEMSSLLNLSLCLLKHDIFRKYSYFPARLIMQIVLQLEHVYSVKNNKGPRGVHRLFLKDITASAKSTLALPGDGGKNKIKYQLDFLDIVSKILKLDFNTGDVSEKSNRNIKSLCDNSCIIIKRCTGSELYNFYSALSEPHHANIASIGASNFLNNKVGALAIFEISIEFAIRFCEMIVNESKYGQLDPDIKNIKRIAGI